jgi:beta-galactosidase
MTLILLASLALIASAASDVPIASPPEGSAPPPGRERLLMDSGWRFAFGHPSDPARDFDHGTGFFSYFAKAGYGDGPAAAKFDDTAWRSLNLPHDWAVEAPFAANGSSSHGYRAIGRNFPEASVGWYRKAFSIPASDLGRRIVVEFDGVFRDSAVWINGFYLGRQSSGYTSFRYDLTDYLNYGAENVIAVRVDATMEEGWFYEGAGIYRHVWLAKTAPLHVAPWGTAVTTDVKGDDATVKVVTTMTNEGTATAAFILEQTIVDASNAPVATATSPPLSLEPGVNLEFPAVLQVPHPQLWSVETPALYKVITIVRAGGADVDRFETPFGIRTIRFDPNEGFFLNGKRVELKGTNNHQDSAGVGVAVPDALWDFRVRALQQMGSNAYRCSHNPPAPELLAACDRLGMLVIDENRLMGTSPEQLGQLEAMIRRDRNHPSVILWSLGNEEWALEGNIKGARVAASMQALARRIDPSRRTTVANSGGWGGISSVIDVVGYNYIKQSPTDEQHAKYPRQPGVGTEESTTRQTRGIYFDDPAHGHLAPQENASSGGNMELGWQHYAARPYLAGLFYWTGFDYRGEPNPYEWPQVASQSGILDSCGFPKDGFYYLKAWWNDAPVVHLYPHWNRPGKDGKDTTVRCYSNCDEVELVLNERSLGRKAMPRNGHLEWKVVYEPGVLEGRGYRAGRLVGTDRVETTGEPAAIRLIPDRALLRADNRDVAVITAEVVDSQGRVVPTAGNLLGLELAGPGRILGTGNGDPSSHEAEQSVEGVERAAIEGWHGRIAPPGTTAPSPTRALAPLAKLGNWLAPLPNPGEIYDLAGEFWPRFLPPDATLTLFVPSFGQRTTVWLNGTEVAHEVDTATSGTAIPIERSQLLAGANRVQLLVVPFADHRNHIPELARLGALAVRTPAPPWQRSVFNGRAQIIVQTGREAGVLRLTAQSAGLTTASVQLATAAAALPPEVP